MEPRTAACARRVLNNSHPEPHRAPRGALGDLCGAAASWCRPRSPRPRCPRGCNSPSPLYQQAPLPAEPARGAPRVTRHQRSAHSPRLVTWIHSKFRSLTPGELCVVWQGKQPTTPCQISCEKNLPKYKPVDPNFSQHSFTFSKELLQSSPLTVTDPSTPSIFNSSFIHTPKENFPRASIKLCFVFTFISHSGFNLPLTNAQPATLSCTAARVCRLAGVRGRAPARGGAPDLISAEMLLGEVNGTPSASRHSQLPDQSPIRAASCTEISVLPAITEMCPRDKFDPGRGRNPSLLQTARKPGRVRGTHQLKHKRKHMHSANIPCSSPPG